MSIQEHATPAQTPVDVTCDSCDRVITAGSPVVVILADNRIMCDAFRCYGQALADAGDGTAKALIGIQTALKPFLAS